MIRKVKFLLKLAASDLRGNAPVHLVALAIIAAAFLTLGVFVLIATNLRALASHWEEKIEVCLYLADGTSEPEAQKMHARLRALPEIDSVEYIGKDRALEDFKAMLGDESDLIEGLDENPLPSSFVIKLKREFRSLDEVEGLAGRLGRWEGVAEVDYGAPLLESFSSAVRLIQGAVLMVGGLIVVAVVFIISNTVRLTMYSRKEEIGIMKLVGASDAMIRAPFLLEGTLQGAAASSLGVAALWALYAAALSEIALPGLLATFTPRFLDGSAMAAIVAGGSILGAAGSLTRFKDFAEE